MTIFTTADGATGSKVSIHKSVLLSALTFHTNLQSGSDVYSNGDNSVAGNDGTESGKFIATFATQSGGNFLNLDDISVSVISQALENVSLLRAQNGGVHSRLAFNAESLTQQKTNMRAALGRMVDVDIAEETTNFSQVLGTLPGICVDAGSPMPIQKSH